ncbi:glutaredoxin family protein [Citricoccus sp.]|uniref:glutaredoxin family protein n=1 Tax=Citricoccus sp. TaxID=1978372 RepID=UPI0028BEF965|nr:glutaredoxin family protein [Citricoccus sp.]
MTDMQPPPAPRSAPGHAPGRTPGRVPAVELLVKDGCHLCADALAVVEEVCGRLGVGWNAVDIAGRPDLAERHAEEIPVLMVDGVQRDFWRIDPVRLERMLTADRP